MSQKKNREIVVRCQEEEKGDSVFIFEEDS
jgi:hypothetical protein